MFKNPRIKFLVVDDEAHMEILLAQKFRNKIASGEYGFYFAHSGKKALQILSQNRDIDLVITDINMPEMDGFTFLRHLKENFPIIRRMVMSAYGDDQHHEMAEKAGATQFITKPISLKALEETIESTIIEKTRSYAAPQPNL